MTLALRQMLPFPEAEAGKQAAGGHVQAIMAAIVCQFWDAEACPFNQGWYRHEALNHAVCHNNTSSNISRGWHICMIVLGMPEAGV